MNAAEIQKILDAKVYNEVDEEPDVDFGYSCDLMSDVLAFAQGNDVLLTGTVNPQVIRTVLMMDIICVIFVRGKKPTEEMIELAAKSGIVLLSTPMRMYEACGMLYGELND